MNWSRRLGREHSPPREEGWLRNQQNFGEAHLSAADRVVAHKPYFAVRDHPGRSSRRLRAIFLMPRPPLLTRRGLRVFHHFVDSSLP
jgi:hypothetical protein